ncbi:MAG: ABC transporter permease [Thermoproteota archaeon]|nr:MAG: ABC transporter permease [Candidatus Korarchaeota archaeon]
MLDVLTSILNLTLVMATPLALAGVGEVYCERSGVLNLGIEGIMLMAAFLSFYFAYVTGSLLVGYLVAVLVGLAMGLLMAFMSITLRVNQVIAGMGIFFLGFGLSDFLYRSIFGEEYVTIAKSVQVPIPVLSDVPLIGGALFKQYPAVYLSYVAIPLLWYMLYRSRWGLSLRAVGENPRAADTLGVNVVLVRYLAVLFGSAMAGLAGGFLCLGVVGLFFENLTFGMGFIAIGLVYFGRWDPLRTWAGSLVFGLAWSVSTTLQDYFTRMGYPSATYFLLMLPYLVIIAALILASRQARAPAALTIPYTRE